jgi:ribonuclease J
MAIEHQVLEEKQKIDTGKSRRSERKITFIDLIFFGGLGEIGKNMLVLETDRELFVIDAGLMFPTDETPGIDLILPDFAYIQKKKDKLRAVILTHGHEDHIGALPYILREVKAPIYGSKLTIGLLQAKLEEHRLSADLRIIDENSRLRFGNLKFEFIPQIHSIPDGFAVAIHTPFGIILHTGDFKFDTSPIAGQRVYYERFAELAKKGVKVLLSDSTNAEEPGITPPERLVAEQLKDIFTGSKGKIIIASFASHIHRIQNIFDAARASGRLIAISGRSMRQSIDVATKTGHLKVDEKQLIDINKVNDYPPHQVCILCTGSQGEPLSALSLIASREHRHISVQEGDTVIIAASPIPGNERSVSSVINSLMKQGADVITSKDKRVHVSGHASQEELKLMINMVKPEYFIPVHGEFKHLVKHARLACETGISRDNVFLLENGESVRITRKGVEKGRKVDSGVMYVDGLRIGDIEKAVLRDRENLSKGGIIFVVVAIEESTKRIAYGPDIISRGISLSDELINTARERAERKIRQILKDEEIADLSLLKQRINDSVSGLIYEKMRKRPMVIPFIFEV